MSEAEGPRSTIKERLTRAVGVLPKEDWLVVGWVLAIKVLLFLFGIVAYHVIENKHVRGVREMFQLWNHWDAVAYEKLAQFGFQASGEFKTWFYPLFPWTIRLVAYVTGNYMASALIVSGICTFVAAVLLRRIVELDFSPEVALRSVWFFLIFPTAYFLHVGYTESLFLSLAIGCLMAARTQRWWLAGLLGGLSCMTRANGVVLIPTLGVELVHQFLLEKRWRWQWLWLALIPLGFGVYLLNNWWVSGDPFAFWHLRKQLFYTSVSWPWVGIREAIGSLHREPNEAEMVAAQELFFAAFGLVCCVVTWIKLRPIYGMWTTANWVLVTSVDFLSGVPRYVLQLFPIFILFALAARNRFWNAVITIWSLLFLALFASLFVRGWWAF